VGLEPGTSGFVVQRFKQLVTKHPKILFLKARECRSHSWNVRYNSYFTYSLSKECHIVCWYENEIWSWELCHWDQHENIFEM